MRRNTRHRYASAPIAHMVGGVAVMFFLGTLWPDFGNMDSGWAPWALSAASRWEWRWISLVLLAVAILLEKVATTLRD